MVGFPRGDGKVSLLRGEVECHGRIREKSMVEVVDRECHADQSGGFDQSYGPDKSHRWDISV